jgi:hypothetical protein
MLEKDVNSCQVCWFVCLHATLGNLHSTCFICICWWLAGSFYFCSAIGVGDVGTSETVLIILEGIVSTLVLQGGVKTLTSHQVYSYGT